MSFRKLFSRHAGSAWLRQMWLQQYLGDGDWTLQIDTGEATVGEDMAFSVQLLGSEAQGDTHTWLWAWANQDIEPAEKSMEVAKRLQQMGVEQAISEFTEATFPLEQADAHALAMVASALDDNSCYFRGPYEGGAVYFLLKNLPEERNDRVSLEIVQRAATDVATMFRVDQRAMIAGLLEDQGFSMDTVARRMTATRGDEALLVEFNAADQVIGLNGRHVSQGPKKWWEIWK
jgi:hypothetical protein